MTPALSLIMDIIVLCALGAAIFYMIRLSNSLNQFKQYRSEFQLLLAELSGHIEKAYHAIDNLKSTSKDTALELGEAVSEAKFTLDEMTQVNEASESLARRLENAAGQGSRAQTIPAAYDDERPEDLVDTATPAKTSAPSWRDTLTAREQPPKQAGPFAIRDPDFDGDDNVAPIKSGAPSGGKQFASQAEKDLYEALQQKKS